MLLKEHPFIKIKLFSEYDYQYNGNKIMYLFFLFSFDIDEAGKNIHI